ncbi:MAG: SurA N-terminal domain-containing protein [Elusimicrobiota bacterium]|jgi:hypothetical protein|nr:SurA N-terminal domain-containing protein [Elusimicrobiota bacterium]
MNFFRKHIRVIFIVTVVAFLAGTFVIGFGGASLAADDSKSAVLLTVNDSKVSLNLFNSLYNNTLQQIRQQNPNIELTDAQQRELKARILQELIQTEIFAQEAPKYGVIVSNNELQLNIKNNAMFFNNNNVFDDNIYRQALASLGISAKDFETLIKKQILSAKLRLILIPAVKVSPSEFADIQNANPTITLEAYSQLKVNKVLNEWYQDIMKNYNDKGKIVIKEDLLQ